MEGLQQFNCNIPHSLMLEVKQSGMRYARIVELGVNYAKRRTELDEELLELREGNKKLQAAVSRMGARILELENPRKEE